MSSKSAHSQILPPRLRVAVVGGGIGGLCLAISLSRYADLRVDVYEAAAEFSEIGAGVIFWERTWKVFTTLGLAEDLAKVSGAPINEKRSIGFDYRKSDAPGEGVRFATFEPPYGCIRFHRAHFLDVLVSHLPEGIAHFGKRLTSYMETTDGVHLYFADGTKTTCDLMVGCDGIKSVVRKQMFEHEAAQGKPYLRQYVEPVWSGTMIYRALAPAEKLNKICNGRRHRILDDATLYCGKNKHVVCYAVGYGATTVNIVGFRTDTSKEGTVYDGPWVEDCTKEEVSQHFVGWEPEVQEIMECIDDAMVWGLHSLKPLPFYTTAQVALLGDAAHAMLPHQGVGAVQAIEDAYVLGSLLGDPSVTPTTLYHALKAYEAVRLPFANARIEGSRETGLRYEFNSEHEDRFETLKPAIESQWDWQWENTADDEVHKALHMMKSRVRGVLRQLAVL